MDRSRLDLLAAYLAAFKPLGLVPFVVPGQLRAGDAVIGLAATLLARRADCFTNLVAWEAPAALPLLDVPAQAGALLALGADAVDTDRLGGIRAVLRFDDVSVETVSRTSLRQSLRPDAPPGIARLFANQPARPEVDLMLLGQVFRARCMLRFERGGDPALPQLQALASRAGLRLRPAGGRSLRHAALLEVATTVARPVAWRPAFIDAGPLTPDTFRTMNRMQPRPAVRNFDPASDADLLALSGWMDRQCQLLALE